MAGLGEFAHPLAIEALVEEDALRVARVEADFVADAIFEDLEMLGHFGPTQMGGRFFLMLVELFPVNGFSGFFQPVVQGDGRRGGFGGDEPVSGILLEEGVGQAISFTIDEA